MNLKIFIFGEMVFSLISCEKAEYGDSNGTTDEGDGAKVTFSVTKFDQLSFSNTTRSVDISSLCTRIDLGVYDLSSKTRILKAGQSVDDKGFGSLSVKLATGKYCVVAIAHSGSGRATTTNLEKITFTDNKLTDTFCYCDTIDVGENDKTYEVEMKRVVAMFRLIIRDSIPKDVATMRFFYTGGSSTFNALTGFGCVDSRQTEAKAITPVSIGGNATFEVYTFPHAESGEELSMQITALDASGNTNKQVTFSEVPITRNRRTQYRGYFFTSGPVVSNTFSFVTDDEWGIDRYSYK